MLDVNVDGNMEQQEKASKQAAELVGEEVTGTVKFFNWTLGWGFIILDIAGEDAFVNYKWIVSDKKFKRLNKDDFVIFDLYEVIKKGKKKLQARNVRKIEDTLV